MEYDALKATQAYLILWKLIDRYFPESRWLELTDIPSEVLSSRIDTLANDQLSWFPEPEKLKDDIAKVKSFQGDLLAEDTIVRLSSLRTYLRDCALEYASGLSAEGDEPFWQR